MQTSINKLGFNIYWNIFFSLKLPLFFIKYNQINTSLFVK